MFLVTLCTGQHDFVWHMPGGRDRFERMEGFLICPEPGMVLQLSASAQAWIWSHGFMEPVERQLMRPPERQAKRAEIAQPCLTHTHSHMPVCSALRWNTPN